jgi:D-arabinose 1-dehydrogenase-like Zn-dependent alcohol dehydrogenase
MIADASNAIKLPDSVSFEQGAPLMCAGVSNGSEAHSCINSSHLAMLGPSILLRYWPSLESDSVDLVLILPQVTVWGGIKAAKLEPKVPVGVIGIGGLGSLAVQFLKALGHPTVAIDRRPEGLELAVQTPLQADLIIDSSSATACEEIKKWADNEGLAAVIVCTDDVSANEWSLKLLRVHGTCIVLGLPTQPLQFGAFDLVFKELNIIGSLVATVEEARDMMKVVEEFGIRSHVNVLSMDQAPDLAALYMDQHLKGRLVVKI